MVEMEIEKPYPESRHRYIFLYLWIILLSSKKSNESLQSLRYQEITMKNSEIKGQLINCF